MNEAETRADAPERVVLLGGYGATPAAGALLRRLGFAAIFETQPMVNLADVYRLACLELG
jgi:hypothetical protein